MENSGLHETHLNFHSDSQVKSDPAAVQLLDIKIWETYLPINVRLAQSLRFANTSGPKELPNSSGLLLMMLSVLNYVPPTSHLTLSIDTTVAEG